MQAVVSDPPEPPHRAGHLTAVLYGLLEKDPAKRWNVEHTRAVLRGLLLGPSAAAAPARGDTGQPAGSGPTFLPSAGTPGIPRSPAASVPTTGTAAAPGSPVPGMPGGLPDPWRVGRASVPGPGPAQQFATPQTVPPYQPPGHSPTPRPPRPLNAWLFGAAAILVAVVLVVTAVGYGSGWFSKPTTPTAGKPTASGPDFPVRTYRGQGVSVNVPTGWKRSDNRNFAQFHYPGDITSWLRINVVPDNRTATQILRASHRNFVSGCCDLTDYRRLGLRPAGLDGHRGAELEYVATRVGSGQRRHGLWRIVVVNGRSYQVYMSVPQDRFRQHAKVFAEAVRSLRVVG
jgi:hypothetical protein